MPKPVPPHPDDEFDSVEPESVEILLSDHLKDGDDISIQSQVSTDSMKPKSKITDYHFDSGIINPSANGTPIPNSDVPSDGAPFSPGFAERDSGGQPDTDPDAENSENSSEEEIPTIEGYVILRELGRGGMGVVYKAKQMKLERIVALKMILHHGYLTKETLTRFRTEADALARVAHPGIVQVYEISEHDGQAYFTLEYCGGGSLAREIKKGPFEPKKAAEVVETLARAIHFAHEANIIHRDLKPGNILRTTLGQYKITDFGLAKKLDIEENITQSGAIIGTPGYMAPEQASGDVNRLGPPCDIYALGVILYECITGRVPFRAQNVMDAVIQVVTLEPVAPSRLEPKTPKDLETIILKCLHKTPERRYTTAADLADDLGRFMRGEPILGRPASFSERSWKWVRKHPATTASLAMSVLGFFALMALIVWKNQELEVKVQAAIKHEAETQAVYQEQQARFKNLADVQDALSQARKAAKDQNWEVAKTEANRTIKTGEGNPDVENELEDARSLLAKAEAEILLAEQAKLREAELKLVEAEAKLREEQLARNQKLRSDLEGVRDQIRHLASQFTKLDAATRNEARINVCNEGLKLFGLASEVDPVLSLPKLVTPEQEKEFKEGCFELYLTLADVAASNKSEEGETPEAKLARLKKAMVLLDRAAMILPDDASWYRRKSQMLSQAGEVDAAIHLELQAAGRTARTAFEYFLLGQNEFQLGRAEEAKRAFNESLRLEPGYFWAEYYLALTALLAKPESPVEAKAYINFCLAKKPKFDALYILRATANIKLKEYSEAEADFQKALELDLTDLTRFAVHFNRAAMRQEIRDLAGALTDLRAAREIQPESVQLYSIFARIYWMDDKLDLAIAELDEGIRRHPKKDASLYNNRAFYRVKRGDRIGAIADYEIAIALESPSGLQSALDRLARAKLLREERKFDAAISACDEIVRVCPLWLASKSNRLELLRLKAESLAENQKYREALETWADAVKLDWRPNAEEYRFRGLCHAKMGHLPEALADLTQALEKNSSATTLIERGWIHLRSNAMKLAEKDFDEAYKASPSAEALSGRGLARTFLGNVKLGVEDAELALSRAGESKRVVYSCARIYAFAANRIAIPDKGKPVPSANVETRSRYQAQAIALLAKTMDRVPSDQQSEFWKEIGKDETFQTLAKLPEFVKLDRRYATPRATQP